jgi:ABC-type Na+ efflux pump permease subunit
MSEERNVDPSRRPVLGWFVSVLVGTPLAWLSSAAILPWIFGIERKDSASLWMLSGAVDLVFGFLCIPAFLIAHSVSYVALKNADTTRWRAFRSTCQGIAFFWVILVMAWGWHVNGPVFRAN